MGCLEKRGRIGPITARLGRLLTEMLEAEAK